MTQNTGYITRIVGPVIDVKFADKLPDIYNALNLTRQNKEDLFLE